MGPCLLRCDIGFDLILASIADCTDEIAWVPQMSTPKSFLEHRKLFKEKTGSMAFECLDYAWDIVLWATGDEHVDMVFVRLHGNDLDTKFRGNSIKHLLQSVIHIACQHLVTVFNTPNEVIL